MSATILVAYDENRVIGHQGKIPWRLPEDMRMFRERTIGKTVIMGRKTFDSYRDVPGLKKLAIPHLPDRTNIVITSNPEMATSQLMILAPDAPVRFMDMERAFKTAELLKAGECFIIGGEKIYGDAIGYGCVDRIIASEVPGKHDGDAFFPKLGVFWREVSRRACEGFNLVEYEKTL